MAEDLRRSPLDAIHRELGARMVPFGGWDMPLSYPEGTLAEHAACRHGAVVFDVSHLGTVRVTGAAALERLQYAFTNDLAKIEPGRAQYTHLLDPNDGSVMDDLIVWWVEPERFDVMPNASNTAGVRNALAGGPRPDDLSIEDVTGTRAVLAIQGPEARQRLAQVCPSAGQVRRFRIKSFEWQGAACIAAGTGYTGEDGIECAVPSSAAPAFWSMVVGSGILPAGLGARDTLRLEAGFPLYGHELGPGITPLQAGLGWVVDWEKPDFRGKAPLNAERERGVARRLRGLSVEGRRPPREGQPVVVEGTQVGVVTSGNFSPELGHGIALAFLPPEVETGASVEIDARGRSLPAQVVDLPFVGS